MENIKERIKAIIFDMDGTIVQTEHIWEEAKRKILAEKGVEFQSDGLQKEHPGLFLGTSLEKHWQDLKEILNLEDSVEDLINASKNYVAKHFVSGVKFIEGFEEFHKKLKANNIPTCIATNCDDESLSALTKSMNLSNFFGKNIFNISNVNNKAKPDPALFLHGAKKLGVNPEECVVFEDSLAGFQAAKAAGMKCIAIENKNNLDHLYHADEVIKNYRTALEILYKIAESYSFVSDSELRTVEK